MSPVAGLLDDGRAPRRRRWAVLVSGGGTNLQALLDRWRDGHISGECVVVVSNRPGVRALERAEAAGVPAVVVDHTAFADRGAFDAELVRVLHEHAVELIVLAGFMRVLTPTFLDAFPMAVLNVHPSLLPAFPGRDAPRQAIARGAKVSGITIHFVEEAVDAGPYIAQAAVPVLETDDVATLVARIQRVEHRLFPKAVQKVLAGEVRVEGRVVHVDGGGL